MKYTLFRKQYNKDNLPPCILLLGDDLYFKQNAIKYILKLINLDENNINFSKFNIDAISDFINSLNMFPFLSEKRVSILLCDDVNKENLSKLEKYSKDPNPTSICIVNYSGDKKLSIEGCLEVDCSKESKENITSWIIGTFKRNNIAISPQNAELISKRLNMDMMNIANYVNILSSYKDKKGEILKEDIELLVPDEIEAQIFDLVEAILNKNLDNLFLLISKMKSQKLDQTSFVSLVYGNYRRMFLSVTSDKSLAEIAEVLGVKEYAVSKSKEMARKFTKMKLKRSLEYLQDVDYKSKNGMISSQDLLMDVCLKLVNI